MCFETSVKVIGNNFYFNYFRENADDSNGLFPQKIRKIARLGYFDMI